MFKISGLSFTILCFLTLAPQLGHTLIGGTIAPPNTFGSWVSPVVYLCGGVMISPHHILTAGHCVTKSRDANGIVWSPIFHACASVQLALNSAEPIARLQLKIDQIFVHPTWEEGIMLGLSPDQIADNPDTSDLAILVVTNDVDNEPFVPGTASPALIRQTSLYAGEVLTSVGNGCETLQEAGRKGQLRFSALQLTKLEPGRIVGLPNGYCLGDSGSPVYSGSHENLELVGIASTTTLDGGGVAARVDASSSAYLWIRKIVVGP